MTNINSDSTIGLTRSVQGLRARVSSWRDAGQKVALIPTMGALHEGHLSLVRAAKEFADRTVTSIFVNPRQFAPHEDLETYPRNEQQDIDLLSEIGCDLAYVPTPDQIYPEGYQTAITVEHVAQGLCGGSRPVFFGGIATVVCKLLNQCQPDIAVFGEKDFQQLLVIKRMVRDLDMQVEIVGAPIKREDDGLAMSSRNRYLSEAERKIAGRLNQIMREASKSMAKGDAVDDTLKKAKADLLEAGFNNIDYLEVRHSEDLKPLGPEPLSDVDLLYARLFAASMLGKTRLIDNMKIDQ